MVSDVDPRVPGPPANASRTLMAAMARGALGRCPSCGTGGFFAKFLKPVSACAACGQDWSHQQADDFPAYLVIFVIGHLLAPVIIAVQLAFAPPVWVQMLLWVPLAAILMIALLQPAKGAVIAVQWWFGMHGFDRPQRAESER